jgi:hypothetical protein
MIVFRLTDELVRRHEGKMLTPRLPERIECDWDDATMSQSCMEWIVRYEAYRQAMAEQLGYDSSQLASNEEQFIRKI